ncbi:MAG TPA: lytic transglycosylase domain-containing protein [Thermoanaerobaculia bacterium]
MPELKTKRPYQERFLDNFDRAQLRRHVEAVPRKRFARLKKKYATIALGATLAVGGIGTPLALVQQRTESVQEERQRQDEVPLSRALAGDIRAAHSIARQVAGGVEAATGVGSQLETIAEAPQRLALVTEQVREDFFKTEVPFGSIIYREAVKNDIRPELVAAVVEAESQFKPAARSGAGAVGLMQLVPRTGKWMGAKDLTNPVQNITAGTKYLRYLSDRFDGNETKILAAYNAGEGNVQRFGGVPPFKETQNYLVKVRNYEKEYHSRVESRVVDATVGGGNVMATR